MPPGHTTLRNKSHIYLTYTYIKEWNPKVIKSIRTTKLHNKDNNINNSQHKSFIFILNRGMYTILLVKKTSMLYRRS